MQSYEEAGGYGLPAYYDMGLGADSYAASSLMAAYGLPSALAATRGLGAAGLGGIPRRGMGVAGISRGRGAVFGRGALGMMARGGLAGMSLGGMGARGTARGAARGARGGGGGGKMMRGRGGAGAAGRFNPMRGGGAEKKNIVGNESELGYVVFAYNIGENTTEEDVTALFSLYGTVAKVDVIWDYEKNITKGYAFITMPNYEEAEYAIQQLDGYNYAGKPLQVKFKTDKKK